MTTLRSFMPRKGILASWEEIRNTNEVHWAMECFAEMVIIFIEYTYAIDLTLHWTAGSIHVRLLWYKSSEARNLSVSLSSTAGVGSTAGFVIGNTIKAQGLSSMSLQRKI